MNLLCPACHTPLPADADAVVTCSTCAAEVDVTRAGTISGRPRFVPEIDRTGADVGGYRVQARIGGGGMGTVYRAAAADGTIVALKFLAPALADNPDVVARFAREIVMLTRLDHPAIVRVHAHGTQDGTPWFAMELVEGSDLKARIGRGPLPPSETAPIFGRLFAGLAHAHERGVVHRDLKPANVLLGAGGAQLADFGIARFEAEMLGATMVTRLTETAAVLGTLPYMSPEQRRGGAVDRRSDLFSAGVMLYEAATGTLPQGAFTPPSELTPTYGRAFDRLVTQLLQADPARRPAGAADAAAALSAALVPRRPTARAIAASAGALVLLLAGGSLGLRAMFRNGDKKADTATALGAPAKSTSSAPATARGAAEEAPANEATPTVPVNQAALLDNEVTKVGLPPPTTADERPRARSKTRLVLKAVSDVKQLRAKTTKASAAKPAPPAAGGKKPAARSSKKKASKIGLDDELGGGGNVAPAPPARK